MGQAAIVIWDLEKMAPVQRFALHKGKVQALTFSHDEQYLASLGGPDDNKLVVWDLETGDPVCGAQAANDVALTVKFFNNNSLKLVTGGNLNLRQWDVDLANRKVRKSLGCVCRVVVVVCVVACAPIVLCRSLVSLRASTMITWVETGAPNRRRVGCEPPADCQHLHRRL